MEHLWWSFFAKIVNDFYPLSILKKSSMVNVRPGFKCAAGQFLASAFASIHQFAVQISLVRFTYFFVPFSETCILLLYLPKTFSGIFLSVPVYDARIVNIFSLSEVKFSYLGCLCCKVIFATSRLLKVSERLS